MEYYLSSDQTKWLRTLAIIYGHKIVAEATNPNTCENGILIEFSNAAAAQRFQEVLGHEFHAECTNLDQEAGNNA